MQSTTPKALIALLLAVSACAKPTPATRRTYPAGSKVACGPAALYFEHQRPDGQWEPAQFTHTDGAVPAKGSALGPDWYYAPDRSIRLRYGTHHE